MTVYVEEYTGIAPSNRPERFQGVPMLTSLNAMTQVAGGGAVSTISLAANTTFVAMMSTAGGAGFYIAAGSSTGSTATGSTGYIPSGAPGILRGVKPSSKLFVWST